MDFKRNFVQATSTGDISLLTRILPWEGRYKGLGIEHFVTEIRAINAEFIENNDNKLIPINGVCNSSHCLSTLRMVW